MRAGLSVPNFPPLGTPDTIKRLAEAAPDRWDGLFVWDHLTPIDGAPCVHDVWSLLRIAGEANERLVVGPMIAALGRRTAAEVAERALELEAALPGRVIVGFGSGVRRDLLAAGVTLADAEVRQLVAERAEELRRQLHEAGSGIVLWTSGKWPPRPGGLLGASVADGAYPIAPRGVRGYGPPPPDQVADVRAQVGPGSTVAFTGQTAADGALPLADYAEQGLDWWLEDVFRVGPEEALALAGRGPGVAVVDPSRTSG